jgi:hypothetical protein
VEKFKAAVEKLEKAYNFSTEDVSEPILNLDDGLISFETKVQFLHEFWDKKYSEIMQRQKQLAQ